MMNLYGGFGGVFLLVYVALIAAIIGAIYWLMRYLRQLTKVNEIKERILLRELRNMDKEANQSSSEST